MSASENAEDSLHDLFRSAYRARPGRSGPGDDCASLRPPPGRRLALSSDQVVAGVHLPADAPPAAFARKLLRRALSDLAAAGARPWAASWTVAAPRALGLAWLRRLARAFLSEAEVYDLPVVGGDLSNAGRLVLGCTVLGLEGKRAAPGRGGARPGHRLCVTGRLGAAVSSGRHRLPEPRLEEGRRLVQRHRARALMDLSDGLARDLPRLLRASGVGAQVDLERLPLSRGLRHDRAGYRSALGEGEDYELLAALEPASARRALADPLLRKAGFHEIGTVTRGRRLIWMQGGASTDPRVSGFEHRWS